MPNCAKHLTYTSSFFLTQLQVGGIILLPIPEEETKLQRGEIHAASKGQSPPWAWLSVAKVASIHLAVVFLCMSHRVASSLGGICFLRVSVSVNQPQRQNPSKHEDKIGIWSLGGYGLGHGDPSSP